MGLRAHPKDFILTQCWGLGGVNRSLGEDTIELLTPSILFFIIGDILVT